jgi:hypothetical protein
MGEKGRKERKKKEKKEKKEYQLTWTSTSRLFPVLSQIVPSPHL